MKKLKTPKRPGFKVRFLEYSASEGIALVMDLFLLWILVSFFSSNYLIAAAIAYISAMIIHYHTTRHHIFRGSIRTELSGFAYFLAVGVAGLIIALFSIEFIVQVLQLNYLSARFIAALPIIPATFILNKYITFSMPHPWPKDEKNLYCNIPGAYGE